LILVLFLDRPNLLLEQLLMNLKVEWAARVFNRLQVDLALMREESDDGARHHGCTVKVFDGLLARYAANALEFQVIQPETSQGKEIVTKFLYGGHFEK
jgi:hypothetical protein